MKLVDKITLTCAVLAAGWAPFEFVYDQIKSGPKIEKLVYSPTSSFSYLTESEILSKDTRIVINGEPHDHIILQDVSLENIGKTIVTPEDFVEPVRLRIEPPYEFLAVTTMKKRGDFDVEWRKVDDHTYEAKRFLFNPGEKVYFQAYISHDDRLAVINRPADFNSKAYKFNFTLRLKGLKDFVDHENYHENNDVAPLFPLDLKRYIWLLLFVAFWGYLYVKLATKSEITYRLFSKHISSLCALIFVWCSIISLIQIIVIFGPAMIPKEHVDFSLGFLLVIGTIYLVHLGVMGTLYRSRIKDPHNTR